MVDYDKLYNTYFYNWTILSDKPGEKIFLIYCKKSWTGDWVIFSYYVDDKRLKLPEGTMIYCNSIEKANKLVYDVLKIHRWEIHERYFKVKKMLGQKIEHKILNINMKIKND